MESKLSKTISNLRNIKQQARRMQKDNHLNRW